MKCIRCIGNAAPGDMFCAACRVEMTMPGYASSPEQDKRRGFQDKVDEKELDRYDSFVEEMARAKAKADAQASSLDKFQHAKNHAIRLKLEQIEDLLAEIKRLL